MVFFGIATEKLTQIKNGERNPPKCLKIFFNGAPILSIDSRHRPLHNPYIGLFLFSHKHCVHFFVFSMRLPSPRAHPRPPPRSTLPPCRPPSLVGRLPLLPPRPPPLLPPQPRRPHLILHVAISSSHSTRLPSSATMAIAPTSSTTVFRSSVEECCFLGSFPCYCARPIA
jgi:hypothetical protein